MIIPITTFYFWPKVDGWQLLKHELKLKPWLLKEDRIKILNNYTRIINTWSNNYKNIKTINFVNLQLEENFSIIGVE